MVELDGAPRRIEPGEELVVPPGQWREFLTERFAYAHAVGERSDPGGFLQAALWLRAYPDVLVLERPPRAVQRVPFPVLAVIARATSD